MTQGNNVAVVLCRQADISVTNNDKAIRFKKVKFDYYEIHMTDAHVYNTKSRPSLAVTGNVCIVLLFLIVANAVTVCSPS